MKQTLTSILISVFVFFILLPLVSLGASYLFVNDNGNVGIGNTDPQHRLDVSGAIYSRLVTSTASSSAATINWNDGNIHALTLGASNTDLSFTNGKAGGEYTLILNQDSTGGRTVDWPSSVKWPGGNAPTLTTDSNAIDVIRFVFDGTNYLGSFSLDYQDSETQQPIVYLSDDFNRSDNSDIGNGWTTLCAGTGASLSIDTNRLKHIGSLHGGCEYYRTDIATTSGISIVNKFGGPNLVSPDGWENRGVGIKGISSSFSNLTKGYGVKFDPPGDGVLYIMDNDVVKATGTIPFTFNNTDTFAVEIDISAAPQNWIDAYIWNDSVGSKPVSPTVSFHNGGSDYTPSASGNAFYASYTAHNNGGPLTIYNYLYEVKTLQ